MKKILFVLFAVIFTAGSAFAASVKLGYVDTQTVFDKTKEGQKFQGIIKEYYASRKKILDIDAEEIKKLQEEFGKQGGVLTEKAKKEKEEAIRRKMSEFEKKRNEFNDEISKKNEELSKEFDLSMMVVVKQIAKKEGIGVVFNKTISIGPKSDIPTILYADEEFDLTDRVVAEMDKAKKE